ncbi:MAG: hypothetical protein AB7G04_11270, partial [Hyphomonadaceae bacterium]
LSRPVRFQGERFDEFGASDGLLGHDRRILRANFVDKAKRVSGLRLEPARARISGRSRIQS